MTSLFDGLNFNDAAVAQSPVTGLSREHWVSAADHLLIASEKFQSSSPWLYYYPGAKSINGHKMDGLEGFARTLLLGSFRLAADDASNDSVWSTQLPHGLAAGAKALKNQSTDAWPRIDPHSQSLVEAASIATSLAVARSQLWEPLTSEDKNQLATWLSHALVPQGHLNNWALFPAVIAASLRSLGHEDPRIAPTLAKFPRVIEGWELSHGWYSDGPGTRIDYYNAWAFHYYLPLIAYLSKDNELAELARLRSEKFLDSFPLFFSTTGAPIYFGRSLTYRFANVAPLWTSQLIGAKPDSAGSFRAIASQTLRYFVENGAFANGALSIGWHGENLALAQEYSSAGSPLWSAKAFVGLLLGPSHPAWVAPEVPTSFTQGPVSVQLASSAGFLVDNSSSVGIAKLHLAGVAKWPSWAPQSRLPDPLYDKLAYSSVTAPYSGSDSPDNTVFVSSGSVVARPATAHLVRTGENWISSHNRLWGSTRFRFPSTYRWGRVTRIAKRVFAPEPWHRATMSLLTLLSDGAEIHLYRISGVPPQSLIQIGWYAISDARTTNFDEGKPRVQLKGKYCTQEVQLLTPGWALAIDTRGDTRNPFGEHVEIPRATATADDKGSAILGVVVRLSSSGKEDTKHSAFEMVQHERLIQVTNTTSGDWLTISSGDKLLLPTSWNTGGARSPLP